MPHNPFDPVKQSLFKTSKTVRMLQGGHWELWHVGHEVWPAYCYEQKPYKLSPEAAREIWDRGTHPSQKIWIKRDKCSEEDKPPRGLERLACEDYLT